MQASLQSTQAPWKSLVSYWNEHGEIDSTQLYYYNTPHGIDLNGNWGKEDTIGKLLDHSDDFDTSST